MRESEKIDITFFLVSGVVRECTREGERVCACVCVCVCVCVYGVVYVGATNVRVKISELFVELASCFEGEREGNGSWR